MIDTDPIPIHTTTLRSQPNPNLSSFASVASEMLTYLMIKLLLSTYFCKSKVYHPGQQGENLLI